MEPIRNNAALKNLAIAACALLVAFLAVKTVSELKSMAYIGKSTQVPNTITVAGKGEVLATPDIAAFSFMVSEEALVVSDAQKKVDQKMASILDFVKESGVEEKDVKTLAYDIYPRYDYRNATYSLPGRQVLAGYVVSQTVQVKIRKLEDAGKALSGIGEFGATNVSGLSFSVDKIDEIVREARDKAIIDAREQAEKLAQALGVRLGSITSFYEQSPYNPPIYYAKDAAMNQSVASGQGGGAELPGGESTITSQVTVTYDIR